jgi:hypothetical protein
MLKDNSDGRGSKRFVNGTPKRPKGAEDIQTVMCNLTKKLKTTKKLQRSLDKRVYND